MCECLCSFFMPQSYPLATGGPWYKDVSLWVQLFVQVAGFALGTILFADTGFMQLQAWQVITYYIGLPLLFIGLILQRWFVYSGLMTVTVSLVLLGISAVPSYPVTYVVVCFEAWYISAFIRRRTQWWLFALWLGSLLSVVWGFICVNLGGDPNQLDVGEYTSFSVILTLLISASIGLSALMGRNTARRNVEMETLAARAELATVSERNRIAREMHDIVAHSLTVVIAQADGGRYAGRKDPDKAIEALETIADRGRDALSQMRSLLSVLHDGSQEDREVSVAPGVAGIPDLLFDAKRSGLEVDYQVSGEPQALEEVRDLTVYRIVQECLTNVMKHAGGVRVVLSMEWSKDKVLISVDNQPGEQQIEGSGRGLAGIAERARVHGGTAHWGLSRLMVGGWNVTVELPTGAKRQ